MITSRKMKASILSLPGAWFFLIPLRFIQGFNGNLKSQILTLVKWSIASREVTNYSYHSTYTSKKRLATVFSKIEGISFNAVMGYCAEVTRNRLLDNIYYQARAKEKMLRNLTDRELRAGRQILYYCLTRALKPKVAFEAGTAHGIGSLLILHALRMNADEGYAGKLVTVDLNPNAGKLLKHLPSGYSALLHYIEGDTKRVLESFSLPIDLFFHDTVNIAAHERMHYELLNKKLSHSGVICTSWGMAGTLADYSENVGRQYLEFTIEPEGYWACDTMGISLPAALKVPLYSRLNASLSSLKYSEAHARDDFSELESI